MARTLDHQTSTSIDSWCRAIEVAKESGDRHLINFTLKGVLQEYLANTTYEEVAQILKPIAIEHGDDDIAELCNGLLRFL